MSNGIEYLDKHGLFALFPASPSTIRRLRSRDIDPFPSGKLIGGKRYTLKKEALDWLHRQDAEPDQDAA